MVLSTIPLIVPTPFVMGVSDNSTSPSTNTTDPSLEPVPEFHSIFWLRIAIDLVIFLISVVANIAVMTTLLLNRRRKSRVNMLILHLMTADLLITVINIPTDIAWHLTVVWIAGNAMCKIIMFLGQFCMSVSAFLLIVISLDRYAAIVHPLSVNQADKRCKIMLRIAWLTALILNVPQLFVHETTAHPQDPNFVQCIDHRFQKNNPISWILYHVFVTLYVFGLPLVVIITCYSVIVYTIYSKGKKFCAAKNGNVELRKSGGDCIPKARMRAVQMTAILVTTFVLCWSPYFITTSVFHIDQTIIIPPWLTQLSLALGFSNACIDPIVYGMFTINFSREFQRCCSRGRQKGGYNRQYWRGQSTNQAMSTRLATTSLSHPECTSHQEMTTQPDTSESKSNCINYLPT